MFVETQKLIVFIDSSKATHFRSNDDFDVDIPNKVMTCDINEHIELEVSEFTCKRDFYAVQSFNSSFSIFYNGADHLYTLTTGNPTATSLDTEIKQDFEAEFSTANSHSDNEVFSVSFSQYTGRITISSTFSGSVPSDIALNLDVANSAFEVMGFSKKKHNFTINSQSITLTGDRVINVGGETNIFLRTSLVSSNVNNTKNDGLQISNIIAKFPILTAYYSNITFFNTNKLFTSKIISKNLNSFRIRLTNENDELIGLQSNSMMTFTFRKYRKVEDRTEEYLRDIANINKLKMLKKNI